MELEHSFTVPVPEERAWEVLLDVERVAPCMPGATLDSVDGDDDHGPDQGQGGPDHDDLRRHRASSPSATGTPTSSPLRRPARRPGAPARRRPRCARCWKADGDQTHVIVHTTLNVTGKPAQFGRGVMAEVGGS